MKCMKCMKCGVQFSQSDIEVMEEGEEPICDMCESRGEFYLITHDGTEFVVEAENSADASENWRKFAADMEIVPKDELPFIEVKLKKIEHAVLYD